MTKVNAQFEGGSLDGIQFQASANVTTVQAANGESRANFWIVNYVKSRVLDDGTVVFKLEQLPDVIAVDLKSE